MPKTSHLAVYWQFVLHTLVHIGKTEYFTNLCPFQIAKVTKSNVLWVIPFERV